MTLHPTPMQSCCASYSVVTQASAAVRLLNHLGELGRPVEPSLNGPSAAGVGARLLSRRDAIQAQGELCRRTTSSLGVESDGLPVDVVEVVTGLVVARVLWSTSTGENSRRGYAKLQKGNIIRRGSKSACVN